MGISTQRSLFLKFRNFRTVTRDHTCASPCSHPACDMCWASRAWTQPYFSWSGRGSLRIFHTSWQMDSIWNNHRFIIFTLRDIHLLILKDVYLFMFKDSYFTFRYLYLFILIDFNLPYWAVGYDPIFSPTGNELH